MATKFVPVTDVEAAIQLASAGLLWLWWGPYGDGFAERWYEEDYWELCDFEGDFTSPVNIREVHRWVSRNDCAVLVEE